MSKPASVQFEASPAEKFFGLSARPFSLTPDLRFAYHSRSHTHALDQVTSALRRREGLIVVTGAIGTGKTMLCRSMLDSFESRTFLSVILDPGLEVEDLLRTVLTDFGIISGIDAPAAGPISDVTRHQFVSTLQQFLASLIPLRAHAVIMIDEAQRLNPRVLEEVRLLSNFETDEAKLLQIVLVGQPDLDQLLREPGMQQLNQRVSRRCELQPLSEAEVGDYIERRLTVAASLAALDGRNAADITDASNVVRFSPAAVKAVAGISGGIPRLVNTLCDRALEAGYERQVRVIDPDAVVEAAERLRLDVPGALNVAGARRWPTIIAVLFALFVMAAAAWWWVNWASLNRQTRPSEAPSGRAPVAPAPRDTTAPTPGLPATPAAAPSRGSSAEPAGAEPVPGPRPSVLAPAAGPVLQDSPAAVAGRYQVAVAAFKTESRARNVASAISAMQVPVSVRLDESGVWFRVIAGPFATRDAAQAAQDELTRSSFTGTVIAQIPADAR